LHQASPSGEPRTGALGGFDVRAGPNIDTLAGFGSDVVTRGGPHVNKTAATDDLCPMTDQTVAPAT
jgi:hypothetical protein